MIIYSYSRADAIEDGVLVDVTETAREAGFKFSVALTNAVYEDCVAWSDDDSKRKRAHNDQEGRLWDVLYMASIAARRCNSDTFVFSLVRVPRKGLGLLPRKVVLKATCGPGDLGEPVITIMQPQED